MHPLGGLRVETIFGYFIFLIVSIRAFVNYREKKTKERMEGERKDQRASRKRSNLQNSLLPKENPAVNGFDISTLFKTGNRNRWRLLRLFL